MTEKLYIVMPAYNEADNIEKVIKEWHFICEKINQTGNEAKLVIANDGSKDNTLQIIQQLQEKYPYLIPIDKTNSGHGATVLYLYNYGIANKATYIFQTDSDGQTRPEEFWQMWNYRGDFDFQIGTRGKRQDGMGRIIVTKTLRIVVWLFFHVWVKDANTPFRLMKAKKLQTVMTYIPEDFSLANVAVSAIAVKKGMTIAWYPITFMPRQGGLNSINMKRIVRIGIKALGDFRRINSGLK